MPKTCDVIRAPVEVDDDRLRKLVREAETELFSRIQVPLEDDREALASAILVENSTVLLTGPPGSGKTTLVRLLAETYFRDEDGTVDAATVNCHQDLNPFDLLYDLDMAALHEGHEVIRPKPLVTARLKFLNEIQRAAGVLHNALLPLLAEREINYRRARFTSPSFLCILDRNPADSSSQDLPGAFVDRVDYGFLLATPHLREALAIGEARRRLGSGWRRLDETPDHRLNVRELTACWQAVQEVRIPAFAELYAIMLLQAFRLCVKEERSTLNPRFHLSCSDCGFRGEICSHLEQVPGERPKDSLLRLAQANAWRRGLGAVDHTTLARMLPYVLGHRLKLRPDLLRTSPSVIGWLEDVAVGQILHSKTDVWTAAATALLEGDTETLADLQDRDLVLRELALFADDPVVSRLRERHSAEQAADAAAERAAGGRA